MERRRSYPVFILFNGRVFNEVRISSHYEEHHSKYMTDELILRFVKRLNRLVVPVQKSFMNWSYFEIDHRDGDGRLYRIIICTDETENFLGVVNCYRRGK